MNSRTVERYGTGTHTEYMLGRALNFVKCFGSADETINSKIKNKKVINLNIL